MGKECVMYYAAADMFDLQFQVYLYLNTYLWKIARQRTSSFSQLNVKLNARSQSHKLKADDDGTIGSHNKRLKNNWYAQQKSPRGSKHGDFIAKNCDNNVLITLRTNMFAMIIQLQKTTASFIFFAIYVHCKI